MLLNNNVTLPTDVRHFDCTGLCQFYNQLRPSRLKCHTRIEIVASSVSCTFIETPASVNSETSSANQPQPTLTGSEVDTGTDSAAGEST